MVDVAVTNTTPTLSDIRDEVYFLVGEDSDTFPTTSVNKIINDSLNRVWKETHREYDTVFCEFNADSFGVVIPDAVLVNGTAIVYEAYVSGGTSSIEKTALSPQAFSVQLDTYETGTPTSFAVERNSIFLYPVPDVSYTITLRYRGEFKPLVYDTDTCSMSDSEISAAKFYTAYVLKIADEEFESSLAFKRLYDEAIGSLLLQETGLFSASQTIDYGGAY
jgi:hypothetical protein